MADLQTIVMIPTYNEAGNIARLLEELLQVDDSLGCVVVDDNSPDGTARIIGDMSTKHPGRIKLVLREGRLGRASAGIRGMQEAIALQPAYIAEMDADFSHDPACINTFISEIQDCDVVVGSRFVPGGKDADRSFIRKQVSVLSNLVFRLILGLKVRDVGSGFKLYRREVLESLPWSDFLSSGISISMEELFRIAKMGFRIKEVPIVFVDRKQGESKLRPTDFIEPLKVSLQLTRILGRTK
ncbi:MAG: polyprenol monophosphomannose synthase [Pseudomonadota bacterium]